MGEGLLQTVLPDKEHWGESPTRACTDALVMCTGSWWAQHMYLEDTVSQKASNSFPKFSGNIPSAKAFSTYQTFCDRRGGAAAMATSPPGTSLRDKLIPEIQTAEWHADQRGIAELNSKRSLRVFLKHFSSPFAPLKWSTGSLWEERKIK